MLVVALGGGNLPEQEQVRRLMADDAVPRVVLAEELDGIGLSEEDVARLPGPAGRLLRRLPAPLALAVEAWRRRRDFDAILTWGERLAFPLAALFAVTPGRRAGHIGILLRPFDVAGPSKLKRLLKRHGFRLLARRGTERLWLPAPLQRRMAAERWGMATERLVDAQWPCDTRFWRPMPGAGDTTCAVGREMRDYATLVEALRPLQIPCHIAAGTSLQSREFGSLDDRAVNVVGGSVPEHVTVGPLAPPDLRELYARSRFTVVPLLPSESDNGVTSVLESLAMGRAVIATDTVGRPEILEDGVTCLLVPPGDAAALRAAIEALWSDPARAEEIGAAGRRRVEAEYDVERWIGAMRAVAAELSPAATGGPAARASRDRRSPPPTG